MMMQDEDVTYYKGYGEHKTRSELAGWHDPNFFRSPMPSKGPSLLMLVLGAMVAYHLYKYLKKRG